MAYVANKDDEQEVNPATPAVASTEDVSGQPTYTGGNAASTSASGGTAATTAAQAPTNNRATQGTGYVNFDKYYAANKDAAQEIAKNIQSKVAGDVNAARTGTQNVQAMFDYRLGQAQGPQYAQNDNIWTPPAQQVTYNVPKSDAWFSPDGVGTYNSDVNVNQQALENTARMFRATGNKAAADYYDKMAKQAYANGQAAANQANDPNGGYNTYYSQYKANPVTPATPPDGYLKPGVASDLAAQRYAGPTDLSGGDGYSNLAGLYQKANAGLSKIGTEQGQTGMLADYTGKQSVDPLDAALFDAVGGRRQLADYAKANTGLNDELASAESDARNRATVKANNVSQAAAHYKSLYDDYESPKQRAKRAGF